MNNINFMVTNILIVAAVLSILVFRWRIRRKSGSQWVLSYPFSLKILSVFGLFFVYTSVSVLIELTPGLAEKVLVIVLSIPAAVLVYMAAAEVFASETSYDDSMLSQFSPWRQPVTMSFDEVVRIENALLRIQFAIYSGSGRVIRVCKWT